MPIRSISFATGTTTGQLADLELRHRRRARCEDRIRCAKDTGEPRKLRQQRIIGISPEWSFAAIHSVAQDERPRYRS
jgi:hypothetical protein